MQCLVEAGDTTVVAIDRQQVLGQVIGADGEIIHPLGHRRYLVDRRGHLDHDARGRAVQIKPLLQQLAHGLGDEGHGHVQLGHGGYHGQQDGEVVQTDTGTQHGTQLGEKDFRVIQADAYATPAKKGIVLLHREIGQHLVTTDIQGTQRHGPGRKGLQRLAIDAGLLILAGKLFTHQERNLGTVQTHAIALAVHGRLVN